MNFDQLLAAAWHRAHEPMTNEQANQYHLEALIGGKATRWREHLERTRVHGTVFTDLPLPVRKAWWRETDYGRKEPTPEFLGRLPELVATEEAKRDKVQAEVAADTAAARTLLSHAAQQLPCETCLRPQAPCRVRCLRSLGTAPRPQTL
jgi:hypothetical protein